ncbi:MAG TPA: hypothetical protein VFJ16_10450 [Longimicrobium sp.]|nr:hypothetical protein [Longimicrobium sp.]
MSPFVRIGGALKVILMMRARGIRFLVTVFSALVVASCDRTPEMTMSTPEPQGIRLANPDASFHLSANERAAVRRGFDVDALERLLAHLRPEVRSIVLDDFKYPPPGEPPALLIQMGDPSLQPLLDEVWAPMWDHMRPGALGSETKEFSGRELARQRAAARGRSRGTRSPALGDAGFD